MRRDDHKTQGRDNQMIRLWFALACLLLSSTTLLADVTGRWTAGGTEVFVLRQAGDSLTGLIQGRAGEPTYKIVDGTVRGNRIFFFVLHDDESDPEVKANGGI